MNEKEFVVVLTQHRFLGNIFLPYFIIKEDKFYTTVNPVKPHELKTPGYDFKPFEKELVELVDKYSDESLMKRFSRAANVSEFYSRMETSRFQKLVVPYLEQRMFEVARILMLSPVRLLNKEVKYANLYDEDEISILPFFAKPVFYFKRTETETQYHLKVFLNEKEIPLLNKKLTIVTNAPCMLVYRNQLVVFEKLDSKKLNPFFTKEHVSVPREIEEKYYSGFVRKTIRDFDVVAEGFHLLDGTLEKIAVLSLDYNLKYEPCIILHFRYGDEQFLPNNSQEVSVRFKKTGEELQFQKVIRDREWENEVREYLHSMELDELDGFYIPREARLPAQNDALYYIINWLSKNKQELEQSGIIVEQGSLNKNYFTGEKSIDVKTGISDDWFDVYATVTFGKFSFPFIRLKNHIMNGTREFELPNGEIAIIPEEWFARYKNLIPFARINKDGKLQFGKHHYTILKNILLGSDNEILDKIINLSELKGNIYLPENLNAELRNYQKEGFRWMYGLHKNGFGGCLADDMGLGKTLQTLALLLKLKRPENIQTNYHPKLTDGQLELFALSESNFKKQPASIIVLPASLVHNWESEIQKFTPALKVYRYVGQQRKTGGELERVVNHYDIILTTYGTVRNDVELLTGINFFYIILDESQYIKNPLSKTFKSIMKLKSEHRIALTGTPIENSLSDLWAQMNFLNKGLLGNLAFFRRFFITPIEKHNVIEQQDKLQILIRPFILRRTKDEVAKDLPSLMEQVVMCTMDEKQQQIYETEKSLIRNAILAGIEHDGVKKSSIIILQGLSRLRQLANHPKMLADTDAAGSGKFEQILVMLENVVAEKHKVLIFSSFVKHLELIRKRIVKENWKYSILTGKTSNRGDVITQFQEDPENYIFLISLKAGGVGLNLTSADYVFLIDPWWNPAAENQAISRSHRIGQNKHVFVYRFITQGSIEEKIQQLQMRKYSLADKFINSNNPLQEITKEEVLNLFR